jgi:hypothetical protein
MGWVWEDDEIHSEEDVQIAVNEMFSMQDLLAGLVTDLMLQRVDEYAEYLATIDQEEEIDPKAAIENMCEQLFSVLESKMLKEYKG